MDLRYNNDYKFTAGKYLNEWVNDVDDLSYLIYCYKNFELNEKNKRIFYLRIIYLENLKNRNENDYCENCSC